MTGPTSTLCNKQMCTQQPIIPVHWINTTTGPRPPLEGPLLTADDDLPKNWITSYMIFIFKIEFMDQILAQSIDVNIISGPFIFSLIGGLTFKVAHLLEWIFCLWIMGGLGYLRSIQLEIAAPVTDITVWVVPSVSDTKIILEPALMC